MPKGRPWGAKRDYRVRATMPEERERERAALCALAESNGHRLGEWSPVPTTSGEMARCQNAGCHMATEYGVRWEDQGVYRCDFGNITRPCPYDKYWR